MGHYNRDRPKFAPSLELKQSAKTELDKHAIRQVIGFAIFSAPSLGGSKLKDFGFEWALASRLERRNLARANVILCWREADPPKPQPDEFAAELETLVAGDPPAPVRPARLDGRLKGGRSAVESGLVIELLKHDPGDVLTLEVQLFNTILFHCDVPSGWRKTIFTMLAKEAKE